MSENLSAWDGKAKDWLERLSAFDDQYAGASPLEQANLLDALRRDRFIENLRGAQAWAARMETPVALACCAQFPTAGAFILTALLPLSERIQWLRDADAAISRLKVSPTTIVDPAQLFSFELNGLGNLGNALQDAGDYRGAVSHQRRALQRIRTIEEEPRRTRLYARTLGNLSALSNQMDRPLRARVCALHGLRALAQQEGLPESEAAMLHNNLGLAHKRLFRRHGRRQDLDQARSAFERCLHIADTMQWHQPATDALGNLGELEYLDGEFVSAEKLHRDQLQRARLGAKPWSEGNALRSIGIDAEAQGRLADARDYYESARAVFDVAGYPNEVEDMNERIMALDDTSRGAGTPG